MKHHMTKTLMVLPALALLLTACANDVANRYYSDKKYLPVDFNSVEVLWKNPTRPFEVIADFQARRETPNDMRKRAAKIGADAVIVSILGGNYSLNEEWADKDRYANNDTPISGKSRISGTAIKYQN